MGGSEPVLPAPHARTVHPATHAQADAEDFDREGLGIWDEDDGPKIMPAWSKRGDPSVSLPTDLVIGLARSVDGLYGSIGAAGMSGDVLVLGAVDRRWVSGG